MNGLALARLLQIASPAFPVGGYSHSQGLESAIEHGLVVDGRSAQRWIMDVFDYSMATYEIPLLLALQAAWLRDEPATLCRLNEEFIATRESAELRAATVQMGFSMRAVLSTLRDVPAATRDLLQGMAEPSQPCVWSAACAAWQIEARAAALAYAWVWAENQVMVAIKSLRFGQTAAQQSLLEIGGRMAQALAGELPEHGAAGSNFTPSLAILSAQHETQYSRLFRS